jgi:hypothetical protein
MALGNATIYEIRSTATASNVNGGGFNPLNANMLADLTTDTDTANTTAPVVSSVSYNFAAGDVGAKLFIKSGTNWIAGWYVIASVTSNKATLTASIGTADILAGHNMTRNTVAGCATIGTPTSGVFTIDYSQQDATILGLTDWASTLASTTLTTATGGITPVMRGNLVHITAGTNHVLGWYEIVNTIDTNTCTIDRACSVTGNMSSTTAKVGGALSLGSSDDAVFELNVTSTGYSIFYIKNGTYTLGGTVTISSNPVSTDSALIEGYNTYRGDFPKSSTRPTFLTGSVSFTIPSKWDMHCIILSGTSSSVLISNGISKLLFVKVINTSTTTTRRSFDIGTDCLMFGCEAISYRGIGIICVDNSAYPKIYNCYIHDCATGIWLSSATSGGNIEECIIAGCYTNACNVDVGTIDGNTWKNNTFYGSDDHLVFAGALLSSSNTRFWNNIIYGFTTGITGPSAIFSNNYSLNNNFYNNTIDRDTHWAIGYNETAINPSFTNVSTIKGSTATTNGSVLTQIGADFTNVVNGQDYCIIVSGTGVTVGTYGISSHTIDTITLDIAPGTNATADKVFIVRIGNDFSIGTGLKALGTPGLFPGGLTTGYMDIGAVQRQEPSSTSGLSAIGFAN